MLHFSAWLFYIILCPMNFLHPQFLFGLFALSIPVFVHLFNFRRTKRIYFSSNRFIQKVKEASTSRLKLKHYLILASRLLFIFFLVMAFAQPYLPKADQDLASGSVKIYLDNSYSMTNEVATDVSALNEGIAAVNRIIEAYPPSTNFLLLTNDFAPWSNFEKGANEISEITTELDVTGVQRSGIEIQNRLQTSGRARNNDVYWISDFQKSTFGDPAQLVWDSTENINIVPLQFDRISNVLVDSIYLVNPFILDQGKVELRISLRNVGTADISSLLLKIYVNDQQVSTSTADIPGLKTAEVSFDLGFTLLETNLCRVSFEDYPVTFDNEFYFTINTGDKISVTEIRGQSADESIEAVYGNKSLFDLVSFPEAGIDFNRIGQSDLVVINQIDELGSALTSTVNRFINEGGKLLLIPGEKLNIDSYGLLSGMPLLERIDSSEFLPLAAPNLQNPFYENVFEERRPNLAMPEVRPVMKWRKDIDALLRFRNDEAYLSKNAGVYVLGSPLSINYSGFANHALFVPVMYKIALESAKKESNLYYTMGEHLIKYKIDSLEPNELVKLIRNDQELIPGQRSDGNNVFLEIPRDQLRPGFYEVNTDQAHGAIAFNLEPRESVLEQYLPDDLLRLEVAGSNVTVHDVVDIEQFALNLQESFVGTNLWKLAVALALFFLLLEILMTRFL